MPQTLMRKVHDHNIEPTLELGLLPQRPAVLIQDACSIGEIHLEERKSGWVEVVGDDLACETSRVQ